MNRDRYDLPLTTSSDRSAAHYRDGMDCMLSAWHGAAEAFDKAIAHDPGFALAYIGRARVHQLNMEGSEARAMAAQARDLVAGVTPRDYPRDAQVLSLLLGAFGLYAFSGRPDHDTAKLAICERHAHHYGEDWWFLSYLGWSNTEAGNLTTGRKLSERAMALRSANANAAHGLSHAMFEQGDMEAGRSFLSQWMPAHDRQSFLHGHLAWHVALTALDAGDLDGALAIYERHIKPAGRPYPPLNIFTDGTSLLWRLSLAGQTGLEAHWRDMASYGAKYFPQAGAHFADVHFALAAAANGDGLKTRLAQLEARDADGMLAPGRAAIELSRGMLAFAEGDNAGAIRLLEPAISELSRIGGSHAQRELWEDTLIVAYLRAGHGDKAASRISARLDRRPSARDEAWSRGATGQRP